MSSMFGPDKPTVICTSHSCRAGHVWPARLALTQCPGCNTQVLAIRIENCPICNEPITSTSIRTDTIHPSMPIVAACQNAASPGVIRIAELPGLPDPDDKTPRQD